MTRQKRPKLKLIGFQTYEFSVGDTTYHVDSNDGKSWDLYKILRKKRDWIDEFGSRKVAVDFVLEHFSE